MSSSNSALPTLPQLFCALCVLLVHEASARSLATLDEPSLRTQVLLRRTRQAEPQQSPDAIQHVIKHLQKYAYLSTKEEPSEEELKKAVRLYQSVAGVPATGEIDADTVAATRAKRCARPDAAREDSDDLGIRVKRFALPHASRWNPRHFFGRHKLKLKWFISKYTTDMPKAVVRSTVKKGFEIWAKQIHIKMLTEGQQVFLDFDEADSEDDADINIRWESGNHGDAHPFDGEGNDNENILAHTFYPDYKPFPLNGDIHFDEAEKWTNTVGDKDTFFPYVLVHEIGHALGLQHSHSALAVMNPHYKNIAVDKIEMHHDDKCGVNWNIVGPSNLCLLVWMASEILPVNTLSPTVSTHSKRHTSLPTCSDTTGVRTEIVNNLQKQLHFSEADAILYGEVGCRFLKGLDEYRNKIGELKDSLGSDFGKMHEFLSNAEDGKHLTKRALARFVNDKTSVLDFDHFNHEFFDDFFAEY